MYRQPQGPISRLIWGMSSGQRYSDPGIKFLYTSGTVDRLVGSDHSSPAPDSMYREKKHTT